MLSFCWCCSEQSEARVAVYFIEIEKIVVKAGIGTLAYVFNRGSISSCFKENCMRRRVHQWRVIEAYVNGKDVFPSSPTESSKS